MIDVKVIRNFEGAPTQVVLTQRGRKVTVNYDNNTMQISGRLNEAIRDVLKLFFPYSEKDISKFSSALLVQADAIASAAAGVDTLIYTVPANSKLFIISAFLSSNVETEGAPPLWQSALYIEDVIHDESLQLVNHYWDTNAVEGDIISNQIGFIDYGFPSGFQVRCYTSGQITSAFGFMGLIVDA